MIHAKFIQLIEVGEKLHALDEEGNVWSAFWSKLTSHRSDPSKNPSKKIT
jgi:hypothetical protein